MAVFGLQRDGLCREALPNGFTVQDQIMGPIGDQIDVLKRLDVFTTMHMGSSRYFIPNELAFSVEEGDSILDPRQVKVGLMLERTVCIK